MIDYFIFILGGIKIRDSRKEDSVIHACFSVDQVFRS